MNRAAIYARFSSDLQSDKSIEDQIALCRTICARAGFKIVATFEDRALSGTSTLKRTGFQAMMQEARDGHFEFLVAEDIDRISRDQADWHTARKRLDFFGVQIFTPAGRVGALDGSVRAMMAEHYIENLAQHVRRGLAGVVRSGRSAGGKAYGYRPVLGRAGELEIIDAEADVIRRIYAEFIDGGVPREIAHRLNADGVRPPRGDFWRGSSMIGNEKRGHGILLNPLYTGRLVWNRVRMVIDPETGKRISRVNAAAEHHFGEAPHLRIVSDEVFEAAKERREKRAKLGRAIQRKPKRPLTGLLRCGACGAGMSIKDRDCGRIRIQCSRHHEAGACSNRRSYYLDKVEAAVIGLLQEKIGDRAAVAYFIRKYNEAMARSSADAVENRTALEQRLKDAQRSLDRTIDALTRGLITDAEAEARIPALREDRDAAQAELLAAAEPPKLIHLDPKTIADYERDIAQLSDLIGADLSDGNDRIASALRSLVETVTVMPAIAPEPPLVKVAGTLERLVGIDAFTTRSLPGGLLVAGERFGTSPRGSVVPFQFQKLAV